MPQRDCHLKCNNVARMYAFLAAKAGKQKFAKLGPTLGLTADEFAVVYLCGALAPAQAVVSHHRPPHAAVTPWSVASTST